LRAVAFESLGIAIAWNFCGGGNGLMKLFNTVPALLVAGLIAASEQTFAGERSDDDHRGAVLEIGTAGEWGFKEGKTSIGPSIAIEVTPIEHWLEIEAGITPLMSKGGTEWEADLVFKKPFQLSKNVEFMVGLGPHWSSTNAFGAGAVISYPCIGAIVRDAKS
jgi:hypothetical protein